MVNSKKVSYFYDSSVGSIKYRDDHHMKPLRMEMTHRLLEAYNVFNNTNNIEIVQPYRPFKEELERFHTPEYINFLRNVSSVRIISKEFGVSKEGDCPPFKRLMDFCGISAGGSIGAAAKLILKDANIAINWSGGLHHAKKGKASGFCYVNDIVLGILELLIVFQRVLYIDIDVHHGDGVEEAFYTTDRVMTVSFHKYGWDMKDNKNFFPGTGSKDDLGVEGGKYYSLNIPLDDGIDDVSFSGLFQPIIRKVIQVYSPEAIVLQAGADSLSGDKLGPFNLSIKGHADCLKFLMSFDIPLMLLGGGGYTIENVARCWCYETAVAIGVEDELDEQLPDHKFINSYQANQRKLHFPVGKVPNKNSEDELDKLRDHCLERISHIVHAPSVQFHETPSVLKLPEDVDERLD